MGRKVVAIGVLLVAASCSGGGAPVIDPGDGGAYAVDLTPADFVAVIDNPWLPLTVGSRWVYEGTDGDEAEHIEVVVLPETRVVMGVTATVVRDTVTVDGELVEDTFDWYAQDLDGNVWYLGEESVEYEGGRPVSTAGSWEAGVDGALPGVIMKAAPAVGAAYRQEYYEGEAEDMAEVIAVGVAESVPFGEYSDLMVTREWTPLSPRVVEEKLYAAGVGLVLERAGRTRVELISYSPAG